MGTTDGRRSLSSAVFATVLLAFTGTASATSGASEHAAVVRAPAEESKEPPPRYVDLRIGASTSAHAIICGQLSYGPVSIEGCGTGAGILHNDPIPELSHYRVHLAIASFPSPIGWLSPRIGVGFSEMQIGADAAGFAFTDVDELGAATAGPSASVGLQSLVRLGAGFELVTDLSLFTAWFAHAPKLARPQAPWQVGLVLSAGVGF